MNKPPIFQLCNSGRSSMRLTGRFGRVKQFLEIEIVQQWESTVEGVTDLAWSDSDHAELAALRAGFQGGLARSRAGWRADIPEVSMSIPGLSQM